MSSELGNIVQFTQQYPLQSYFDAAAEPAFATAALAQPSNSAIVQSTLQSKANQSGYAIGLAPWSQTPVALRVIFGEGGSSSPVLLKPGQVFRPNGIERFQGFEYGLPFGWLGGGTATLFLFKTKDAYVDWNGKQSEVLFHRLRTTILAATSPLVAPSYLNWPNKFPWSKMQRYVLAGNQLQQGQPTLTVSETTRVSLRLNVAGADITADNAARMVFWGTDDFGIGADGVTAVNTDQFFYDLNFPVPAALMAGSIDNPFLTLPTDVAKQASNQWGIAIYASTGSVLIGMTVDICRYGIL